MADYLREVFWQEQRGEGGRRLGRKDGREQLVARQGSSGSCRRDSGLVGLCPTDAPFRNILFLIHLRQEQVPLLFFLSPFWLYPTHDRMPPVTSAMKSADTMETMKKP